MGSKTKLNDNKFSFTLFDRPTKAGTSVLYVRIVDKQTGQVSRSDRPALTMNVLPVKSNRCSFIRHIGMLKKNMCFRRGA